MLVRNEAASRGVREIAFSSFWSTASEILGRGLPIHCGEPLCTLDVVAAARHFGEGYVKAESEEGGA